MRISLVAALIAVSASPATAAVRAASASSAVRFDTRASAQATVGGRIINSLARGGADQPPPANMTARNTTVSAADGRLVPALVYDFE
ncbi:MAG: hypothetical protein ACR2FK_03425 [Sphingomicrobium sp.]